jgi:hypothetical protein
MLLGENETIARGRRRAAALTDAGRMTLLATAPSTCAAAVWRAVGEIVCGAMFPSASCSQANMH